MQGQTSDGLFALAFSDTSGNFTLPATAGGWKVKIGNESGGAQLGYVALNNSTTADLTSGSVSNVDFQFSKATALIYGTVKDDQSNIVAGLTIYGNDWASSSDDAYGVSDAQGNYALGVFGGTWYVNADNKALAANNLISQSADVSVNDGQAVRQDFVLQHVSTHLRGRVIDNTGSPLGNVMLMVQVFTIQGPPSVSLSPSTQGDGTFDVGVSAGHWSISLECQSASARGVVGPSLDFTVVDGVDQSNITLIAQAATAQITGSVHDNHGTPLSEQLYAFTTINGTNYNVCGGNTDGYGNYQLAVFSGNWQVGISGDVTSQGYDYPPNQNVTVTNGSASANFTIYPQGQTPPFLMTFGYDGSGHIQLHLNGSMNQKYRIETTTTIQNPGSWLILGTNTASGGGFDFMDTNSPPSSHRFYRAVLVP